MLHRGQCEAALRDDDDEDDDEPAPFFFLRAPQWQGKEGEKR